MSEEKGIYAGEPLITISPELLQELRTRVKSIASAYAALGSTLLAAGDTGALLHQLDVSTTRGVAILEEISRPPSSAVVQGIDWAALDALFAGERPFTSEDPGAPDDDQAYILRVADNHAWGRAIRKAYPGIRAYVKALEGRKLDVWLHPPAWLPERDKRVLAAHLDDGEVVVTLAVYDGWAWKDQSVDVCEDSQYIEVLCWKEISVPVIGLPE